jgi:DNA-binding NtrC family response regulator
MVCDDEVLMRQVTSKLLRKMGYRTVEAADAVTALEQYRLHAQELVLVVLDVLLPGRSGFEVFRDLHEFDPDLPVLLSSGFGKGEQVSRALKEGLAGFLQKPFGYEGLRGAVEAALSGNNPDFPIR